MAVFAQNKTIRTLTTFDGVAISGGFEKITLREGDAESIAIEADGLSPDDIITEVKDHTLGIRMKKGTYRKSHIQLMITYRNLLSVSNSGASDIEVLSAIKGDKFELNSSGSGNFTGSFEVKHLEVNISGSSDMKLSGKAERQQIAISGSGDVDAAALAGHEADVAINGSGDVTLHVDGPVQTAISGSGKVRNN